MTDFAPEEEHASPDLLHLLTCPSCRSWILGLLLDRRTAAPEEDTRDERYAGLWARLEERAPELIEESRRRAETVDRLFAELMQAPPGWRLGIVQQARFRSLDLLERLLEESHAGQLAEPARAAELARLAARLASLFGEGDEEAAAALPRAFSLAANARRLEGRLKSADSMLAKAIRSSPAASSGPSTAAPWACCAGSRAAPTRPRRSSSTPCACTPRRAWTARPASAW